VAAPWPAARRALAAALLVAVPASGCSFIFSEGAPERHATLENFTCGESYAPPILDTAAAALLGLSALNAAAAKDELVAKQDPADQADARRDINVTIGLATAIALIDTASAIYGYRAVADCQEARSARETTVMRARLLPAPYGLAPYGAPPPAWPPAAAYAPPPGYAPAPTPAPPVVPPEDVPPTPVTPLPAPAPSP
jgi:hypothetical protein